MRGHSLLESSHGVGGPPVKKVSLDPAIPSYCCCPYCNVVAVAIHNGRIDKGGSLAVEVVSRTGGWKQELTDCRGVVCLCRFRHKAWGNNTEVIYSDGVLA